ncbi:class I SAM-dependent methyltransferase [Yoonia sp. 208BN28-4]|uniref:class I SAM-dependent methyltransferase n=1 Tax=Yoonia sp. 208BN28-4 TaxID=3126505 RepID=UPI0030B7C4DF
MATQSRLTTALQDGVLAPLTGPLTLVRPGATYDVSALPRDKIKVCHSFRPDVTAWENAGYDVSTQMDDTDTAIVVVPRAKALARALIAQACTVAKRVIVDGQKTDGVDSLFKDCRKRLGDVPSVTKDHGRIFWFDATDAFADWAVPDISKGDHGFYTTAGVFSDGAIDKGSALLVDALPDKLPARMADFGAGWGYLSHAALTRESVKSIDLIEAENLSLDCARLNITDPRAAFVWADATTHIPDRGYDGIIMNPPFHTGRSADPGLGRAFIAAAARALAPHGKLWMVANRHLPYETALQDAFRNVDVVTMTNAFKVFHATRPIR